jgi:hypothetical protein
VEVIVRNGSESPTLFPESAVVFSPSDSSNKYYRDCDAVIRKIIRNIPLADEEKSFFKIKSVPGGAKIAAIVSSIMTNAPNAGDAQTVIMDDDNPARFLLISIKILMYFLSKISFLSGKNT